MKVFSPATSSVLLSTKMGCSIFCSKFAYDAKRSFERG
jgi:hypothetical protein